MPRGGARKGAGAPEGNTNNKGKYKDLSLEKIADKLGLSRQGLYKKMQTLHITPSEAKRAFEVLKLLTS